MSAKIKLTGIEIDFEEILNFETDLDKKQGFITFKNLAAVFTVGGDSFSNFFADYYAIKYGKNGHNEKSI